MGYSIIIKAFFNLKITTMKLLKFLFFSMFIAYLPTTEAIGQAEEEDEIRVRIDSDPDVDLTEYDSYFWVTDFGNSDDLWITVNSIQGEMIESAIEYEMDVQNMEWSPENADLLVNFHIFDGKYGEEFYVGTAPYEYRYMDKQDIMEEIEDGTVVVSLIDRETGESVWEGYATMVVDENESLRKQQADIRKAVSAIFDRYNPGGLQSRTPSTY